MAKPIRFNWKRDDGCESLLLRKELNQTEPLNKHQQFIKPKSNHKIKIKQTFKGNSQVHPQPEANRFFFQSIIKSYIEGAFQPFVLTLQQTFQLSFQSLLTKHPFWQHAPMSKLNQRSKLLKFPHFLLHSRANLTTGIHLALDEESIKSYPNHPIELWKKLWSAPRYRY